jgi:hypothetical protein
MLNADTSICSKEMRDKNEICYEVGGFLYVPVVLPVVVVVIVVEKNMNIIKAKIFGEVFQYSKEVALL